MSMHKLMPLRPGLVPLAPKSDLQNVAPMTPTTTCIGMTVGKSSQQQRRQLTNVQVASVTKRNARERNRVKKVNQGFDVLRQHLPNPGKGKRLSKVETLRTALTYIQRLQTAVDDQSILDTEFSFENIIDCSSQESSSGGSGHHYENAYERTTLSPRSLDMEIQSDSSDSPTDVKLETTAYMMPDTPPGYLSTRELDHFRSEFAHCNMDLLFSTS